MTTELTHQMVQAFMPARPQDAHKGTFGHAYILAGSRGFTGAAKLCAESAYRAGAGLVTVGTPQCVGDIVELALSEAMTHRLPDTAAGTISRRAIGPALAFAKEMDAVAIGPGLGTHDKTAEFVRAFVKGSPAPMVVDADALNCLSLDLTPVRERMSPCILTPHPGEMARLLETTISEVESDREGMTARLALECWCVVVLKGNRTLVAAPDGELWVNPTGNSGMATGGTGDALTGILAGLLAQGMEKSEAARLGVFLHGVAGDIAAGWKTQRALMAGDLIAALPDAWRCLEQ
jgi:NAD(P)H-hydrate epimerase